MTDYVLKRIEDLDYYQGEHAKPGIKFRYAAKSLGFGSWEFNIIEIDALDTGYPEHDHAKDGAEEAYVVLRGGGTLTINGAEHPVSAGALVRVAAAARRKFIAGPEGLTILAI